MEDLPLEVAVEIYERDYWGTPLLPCEEIAEHDAELAYELFDSAVLHGPPQAATWLQRALNLMNRAGTLYPDLKVDGWAGRHTMAALRVHDTPLDRRVLLVTLNVLQGGLLVDLALRDPSQRAFFRGWIDKRVRLDAPV